MEYVHGDETVTGSVRLRVIPPPAPVTVMLNEPVAARVVALKVSTLDPEPPLMVDTEKLADRPAGNALAESATLALNPPLAAAVSVTVARDPAVTATEDADGVN